MLEAWGYAACYSADPDGTVRLPFDPETGRRTEEVWDRWLAWDPVRMIEHAHTWRSMRAVWLDAGKRDEFFLDLGMTAVSRELDALGVDHRLELFDGGHMSIGYRYPKSLAFLAEALLRRLEVRWPRADVLGDTREARPWLTGRRIRP